jgi:hypothetical protein
MHNNEICCTYTGMLAKAHADLKITPPRLLLTHAVQFDVGTIAQMFLEHKPSLPQHLQRLEQHIIQPRNPVIRHIQRRRSEHDICEAALQKVWKGPTDMV